MTYVLDPVATDGIPTEPASVRTQGHSLATTPLLGFDVANAAIADALDWLCGRIDLGEPTRIAFLNAHCVNVAARDLAYRAALASADAILPDGSGLALAARLRGIRLAANLNGTDLVPALCERLSQAGGSVFLVGGAEGVAESAAKALQAAHPGLVIAGTNHGFFAQADELELIDRINESGADLLLVAMGVPMQDTWLHRVAPRLATPLAMGVGGLFDFLSCRIPRAPMALRSRGLEWVYRLYQEPARMWRRYVLGNPSFVARAVWDCACPHIHSATRAFDDMTKRAMDIAVSGTALIALSPLLALFAAAIKLTSPGPAVFRQVRVGENGAEFTLYKFRSMYIDAETRRAQLTEQNHHGAGGVTFKLKRDPRVTMVGRWLRKSSMDELPQLFNILKGDMSLVGPRPPLPQEVARYTPIQLRRLEAKPGLTCLWQVSGRANLSFERQVALDVEYLAKRTVLLDLLILLRTIPAVLTARGAY
jgi:exopolysaccharide biosynthesis WecB/TagA/CpsF family protein